MITCSNYIAGQWLAPRDGRVVQSRNPATGEPVSIAPSASVDEVRDCIQAARQAFETSAWADDAGLRTRVLLEYARRLRANADQLGLLLTDENGKTLSDSKYEVIRAAGVAEYYAGLAQNVFGHTAIPMPNFFSFVMREPIGVVAVIVPFNFPVVLLLRSLAPALAAGNAVIVKPAILTPGITYELMRILSEIDGLPPGIVSLVSGSGSVVGSELASHPEVDMIALTGSSETGKEVMRKAADTLKKVSLELGGKSPNVILNDADFDKAIRYALKGSWITFGGQVCYAGTRLLVQDRIHKPFVEALKAKAESLRLGYGALKDVQMGPVISAQQLEKIMTYIEIGKNDARLVTGGYRAVQGDLAKGYFVAPTVFDEVPVESRINKEEIFGPVLAVIPFKELDEAVEIANSTTFGLAAAVWTKDVTQAFRLARRIKSGTLWINTYGKLPFQAEMGGFKQSGIGRQYGEEGLHEFTQLKHIGLDLGPD